MDLSYQDIILDNGWDPWFKWFLTISVILHLTALYFGFFVLPDLNGGRRQIKPEYKVNLVTLPSLGLPDAPPAAKTTQAQSPEAAPKPAAKPKPAPAPEPEAAKLVPIGPVKPEEPAPKPEVKKIEKTPPPAEAKPKVDPDQALKDALAKIQAKQKSKAATEDKLANALAGIEKKVATGAGVPYGVQGSGRAGTGDRMTREYLTVVVNIIQANWIMPPESIIGRTKLESIYIIIIERDGRVSRAWFEQNSREKLFDQSVEKAVMRAGKMPPLPDWYQGDTYEIGMRFTPSGISR